MNENKTEEGIMTPPFFYETLVEFINTLAADLEEVKDDLRNLSAILSHIKTV